MRTFQLSDGRSHKFWNIELQGSSFTVTFGKIGTDEQTQTKKFPTPEKAQAAADKLIREKTGKGYIETTPLVATREAVAFERAIAENPDDVGGWNAYADYLAEHGEVRGEFMQVQLALEDESRPAAERKKLRAREKQLLKEHEREWLGELAPYLLDPDPDDEYPTNPEHRWRRGVLSGLTVRYLTRASAQALATAPAARFLHELRVHTDAEHYGRDGGRQPRARVATPPSVARHWELFEVIAAPWLGNLRVFQMGESEEPELQPDESAQGRGYNCHTYTRGLEYVIAGMSRVEELHLLCKEYDIGHLFALPNLTHLRLLRVYHLGRRRGGRRERPYAYPLDILARNPAVANLTHLLFHPHYSESSPGFEGQPGTPSFLPLDPVRVLLRSKHLTSLTHLQLRLSNMGDEGCREIVASGILKRLKWLDLRHGCISDEGARILAECPDAKNLEHLDLSRNAVTAAGLKLLRRAGIPARAERPLTERELAAEQYLFEGDFE